MKLLNKIEAAIQKDREESQFQHPNRIHNGIFEPRLTTRLLKKSYHLGPDYPSRQVHANRFRQEPVRMRPDQAIAQFRLIDSEMQLQQTTKGSLSKSMNITKRTHTKLAPSFGFGSGHYQSPD